jgi:hypothetical protein
MPVYLNFIMYISVFVCVYNRYTFTRTQYFILQVYDIYIYYIILYYYMSRPHNLLFHPIAAAAVVGWVMDFEMRATGDGRAYI